VNKGKKILIRGEAVYDGSLSPPKKADVLVENGIITRVEPRNTGNISGDFQVIEAKLVCPGFIDIHRHADVAAFADPAFPSRRNFGKTELLQGITTTVAGNCGLSPVPGDHPWQGEYYSYLEPVTGPISAEPGDLHKFGSFKNYRDALEKSALPINLGFLAGTGSIRTAVKGFSREPFSPGEMSQAKHYIEKAYENGALGLSIGLIYQPDCHSSLEELIDLVSTRPKTILCAHLRGEGSSLLHSIE